jgi:hypothetical protein
MAQPYASNMPMLNKKKKDEKLSKLEMPVLHNYTIVG